MTAAAHLAEYEQASPAALRLHLAIEHPATRQLGHPAAHQPAWQPDLSDWFALDHASARSRRKAARLPVARTPWHDHGTVRAGEVRGDSGAWYPCLVDTARWWGACARGGEHDHTPEGAGCSHPLALAGEVARLDGAA